MLQEASKVTLEVSVLRRLLFAVVNGPEGTPGRWETICAFAFKHSVQQCSPLDVQLLLENVEFLDTEAFSTDAVLMKELHAVRGQNNCPLGVVLVSPNTVCKECGGKLLTRSDRPSSVVVYSETMGTVPGTHFHKYCQNIRKGCQFIQHYGYYTKGGTSDSYYNEDWYTMKFFKSTNKTVFEMQVLRRLDAEILIGQITYHQSSNTYNCVHQYDTDVPYHMWHENDDPKR